MVWCLGAALFGLSTRRITKQVAVVVVAMVAAVGDAVAVVHVVASDAAASEVFVEMSETHSNTTVCMAALCFSPTSLVAWRFESGLLTNLQQQSHRYTHQSRRNSVICTNLFC